MNVTGYTRVYTKGSGVKTRDYKYTYVLWSLSYKDGPLCRS